MLMFDDISLTSRQKGLFGIKNPTSFWCFLISNNAFSPGFHFAGGSTPPVFPTLLLSFRKSCVPFMVDAQVRLTGLVLAFLGNIAVDQWVLERIESGGDRVESRDFEE